MEILQIESKGWYGGCGDKGDIEGMECQDFEADKLSEWNGEASYDFQEENRGNENEDALDRMMYLLNSSSSSRDTTCFSGGGRGNGHLGKCLDVESIQSEGDNNNRNNFNMNTFESSCRNNNNNNNHHAHQTNKVDKCSSSSRGRVPKSWSSCCWSSGNTSNNVIFRTYLILFLILIHQKGSIAVIWEDWWTYDGISGPAFWGLINPDWSLCHKGHRQSPVNLEPTKLLYDPNLRPIHIDKDRVNGIMTNTGHSVIFYTGNWDEENGVPGGMDIESTLGGLGGVRGISDTGFLGGVGGGGMGGGGGPGGGGMGSSGGPNGGGMGGGSGGLPKTLVNITGGPLSYRYQFHEIHIHYGMRDDAGSEHTVDGYAFPAELQMFGFNSQLYSNFSEAVYRSHGIVAISILLQVGDLSNPELRLLTDQLSKITFSGQSAQVQRLSLQALLPNTDHYMTYEGSTTMPACHETVTWVVLNKPIYITKQQLFYLRKLMRIEEGNEDKEYQKAPLGSNFRPPQPLHHRVVRTNIDFEKSSHCKATMHRDMYYKANSWKNQP